MTTLNEIKKRLARDANPKRVDAVQKFFRTGPGEYGEGDVFISVTVPQTRKVAREFRDAPIEVIEKLLTSKIHEERLLALIIFTEKFPRGDEATRKRIYDIYLDNTRHVNNWDLVDASAYKIVGAWLFERSRKPLYKLARSKSMWEQRISIVSTYYFIKRGELDDTFAISDLLLHHEHDLIHKAVGWMLREAGKQDEKMLVDFLASRYQSMPRTMLRYAIEKFPEKKRRAYLAGKI